MEIRNAVILAISIRAIIQKESEINTKFMWDLGYISLDIRGSDATALYSREMGSSRELISIFYSYLKDKGEAEVSHDLQASN